jgi:hypothetical protein
MKALVRHVTLPRHASPRRPCSRRYTGGRRRALATCGHELGANERAGIEVASIFQDRTKHRDDGDTKPRQANQERAPRGPLSPASTVYCGHEMGRAALLFTGGAPLGGGADLAVLRLVGAHRRPVRSHRARAATRANGRGVGGRTRRGRRGGVAIHADDPPRAYPGRRRHRRRRPADAPPARHPHRVDARAARRVPASRRGGRVPVGDGGRDLRAVRVRCRLLHRGDRHGA